MRYLRKQTADWRPPHCPSSKCKFHGLLAENFAFKKSGFYYRQLDNRRIQRFTCLHCGVTFSTQTFSTTYWQKLPHLDKDILELTVGGMANRQIARALKVSPSTIDRHVARLGRHCMLFHYRLWKDAQPPNEVVIDGFESFELSQYYPFHHNIAVEKDTDFFIYFTDSELRRKGRMTDHQKQRRVELEKSHGRQDPKAIRKDMRHLLDVALEHQTTAIVHSDDHKQYLWPIRTTNCEITHIVTPGKEHRSKNNRLWAVNLLELLIRHSGGNHKRETIAWSKRRQASCERLAIFLVWRNYVKRRREKERRSPTPAMERGMLDRHLTFEDVLEERIFRNHLELPERWSKYYDRKVTTRALGKNTIHGLKYGR